MKRFNKFLVLVIFAGVTTNLVGADWVMPKLDPLAFQMPQDAFAGMDALPVPVALRDFTQADFESLQAQLQEARAAEEAEKASKTFNKAKKGKKARVEEYPAVSPKMLERRKFQARLAAAHTYAQVSDLGKDVEKSALLVKGHPDKRDDLRRGFVLGKNIVDRTIRKAEDLVANLEEHSGTMSVGTKAEYDALVGLHADYIEQVRGLIRVLLTYKDAILEAKAQIDAEQVALAGDASSVVIPVGRREIVERMAPGLRHEYVERQVFHRSVGIEANAKAVELTSEMESSFLTAAMYRVVPAALLGSLAVFGFAILAPVALSVTEAHALIAAGGVFGGGLGMLSSRSRKKAEKRPRGADEPTEAADLV